jgi:hypothetical protein
LTAANIFTFSTVNFKTNFLVSVYDANGQITTGILSGNVNSIADFQECLSVENEAFSGQHCVVELQPFVAESAIYLEQLRRLAQSFDLIKSTLDDVSFATSSILVNLLTPSPSPHPIFLPNSPLTYLAAFLQPASGFVFHQLARIATLKQLQNSSSETLPTTPACYLMFESTNLCVKSNAMIRKCKLTMAKN